MPTAVSLLNVGHFITLRYDLGYLIVEETPSGKKDVLEKSPKLRIEDISAIKTKHRRLMEKAYRRTKLAIDSSFYSNNDLSIACRTLMICGTETHQILKAARLIVFDFNQLSQAVSTTIDSNTLRNILLQTPDIDYNKPVAFIDRAIANTSATQYRHQRTLIHNLFYSCLSEQLTNHSLVLMARKSERDYLRKKYESIGLRSVGEIIHHQIPHWVMYGASNTIERKILYNNYSNLV